MKVGFIGLGIMGRPMAGHLIDAGHTAHLFDIAGVPAARSLALSLPNTATCQELFNAAAAQGGAAWDHSGMVRVLEALACHQIGQNR